MSMSVDDLLKALDEDAQSRHKRYLELSTQADESGLDQPAKFFRAIDAIETARMSLYRRRLTSMAGQARDYQYHICPECGYAYGAQPDECPVCEKPGTEFLKID